MLKSRKHLFLGKSLLCCFLKEDLTGTPDTAHTHTPHQFHHLGKEHCFPHHFQPELGTSVCASLSPASHLLTIHVPWSLVPPSSPLPASCSVLGPLQLL